jgi:L-lactate dehydrogenase complex protein LldE
MAEVSVADKPLRVGLFVTCLVDFFRPSVGFAAIRLLEGAGCEVVVPPSQTCCGQPAYNSGDRDDAKAIAAQVIAAFAPFDYVVAPSGSCAGMLRKHYPMLFADDLDLGPQARALAAKTYELVSFLTDVLSVGAVHASFEGTVTYHDACSGLRELGVRAQPRALLQTVDGLTLVEAEESETCCGFGGTFAAKYPDISNAMVSRKADMYRATKADFVLGGDLGCLMNIAGKLSREGSAIRVRHVAEVLAGLTDAPPIAARK